MEPQTENFKLIYNQKPVFYKIVSENIYYQFIDNDSYEPIFKILCGGPKILSDIIERYNEILASNNPGSDKKSVSKTDNTIYKYIKKLIEKELVIEYATQVDLTKSSTITKTLYALSATYFLPEINRYKLFSTDIGNLLSEIIGVFISKHYDDKFPDVGKFRNFLANIFKDADDKFINFFKSIEDKVSTPEINKFDNALKILNKLNAKNYSRFFYLFDTITNYLSVDKINLDEVKEFFNQKESQTLKDSSQIPEPKIEDDKKKTIIKNDNFKQDLIVPVPEEEWKKYFDKPVYHAILAMLRERPMTVQEIHSKHFEYLESTYKKMVEMAEEYGKEAPTEKPTEISESSIYRHIKELQKAGFIAEAGRVFYPETKTSQILYARKGKVFIHYRHDEDMFESADGANLVNALAEYLKLYLNKSNCDLNNLKIQLTNLLKAQNKALLTVYSEITHDSIIVSTLQLKGNELDVVLATVTFFEFFNHAHMYKNEEIIEGIKNSFSD